MSHRFFRENPLISIQKYDMMALESAPSVKRAARAAYRMKSKELHLMIITQKKPLEEVMAMVGDAKTVAVIGCGLCASTCQTGGAPEVEAMKQTLEEAGKTVVVTDVARCVLHEARRARQVQAISAAAPGVHRLHVLRRRRTDHCEKTARVSLSTLPAIRCSSARSRAWASGGSVQDVRRLRARHDGRHLSHHPVRREPCQRPCGGQKNGKCEVNPENDCAWIQIYKRLEQLRPARQAVHDAPGQGGAMKGRVSENDQPEGGRRHEQIKRSTGKRPVRRDRRDGAPKGYDFTEQLEAGKLLAPRFTP